MLAETSEKDRNGPSAIAEHRTPSAIAAGVAFGIAIGLIPKDSLLVFLLLLFIATLPIHQLLACAVALTLSLVAPWTNHIVHPVGEQILRLPFVGSALGRLYSLPLMPWLRFENTLVVGGTVIGICAWLPSYVCSLWLARATQGLRLDNDIATIASKQLRHRRKSSSATTNAEHSSTPFGPETAAASAVATHTAGVEVIGLSTELQSHHPDDLALATLVLEVQETMLEAARIRSDLKPKENQFDGAAFSTLPLAESHHGAGMTMLSPVDQISTAHLPVEMLPPNGMLAGVIMIDSPPPLNNPILHSSHRETVAIKSVHSPVTTNPNAVPNSAVNAPTVPIAQGAAPLNDGTYRDSSGRQFISHTGSKEESLRHILKHIHSLRNVQKESEKTS